MGKTLAELEVEVADSVREWLLEKRPVLNSADYLPLERRVADAIEVWVAHLLEGDPEWTLRGRWYDGFDIRDASAKSADSVTVSGFIYRIETQTSDRIDVSLTIGATGLSAYEVRFGDGFAFSK